MKQTCIFSCIFTRIRHWVVLNSNILVMLVCIKNMLTYSTTIYYHEPILNFIYDMISNWTLVHIILSWNDMESVYQKHVYIYIVQWCTMDMFKSAVWRVDIRETIVNIYYDIITLYDVAFETCDFDQVILLHAEGVLFAYRITLNWISSKIIFYYVLSLWIKHSTTTIIWSYYLIFHCMFPTNKDWFGGFNHQKY